MAYEERENGTHAMTCDTPDCTHECLSPGKQELVEDLQLAGWVAVGKDQAGNECFACPHCTRGVHPMQAAIDAATGGTGEIQVHAPMAVKKGDDFHDAAGAKVGRYMADAEQGDPVNVKVELPEPPKPPDMLETYDAMLEGSDADDDGHGRRSVVAPTDGHVVSSDVAPTQAVASAPPAPEPAPTPRSMGAPAGADGSGGVVQPATNRPDLTSPEAQARLRTAPGPKLDTAKLDAAAKLFDNLDPSDTDWDPDAD